MSGTQIPRSVRRLAAACGLPVWLVAYGVATVLLAVADIVAGAVCIVVWT